MSQEIICITGMHRSGTSLTASWLQKCGLKIDNGKLYGSTPGNVKGHFEDVDFVNLHAKCIMEEIPESKGWIINNTELSFSEKEINEAKKLIFDRKDYSEWGWKDPRSTLFLEDWIKLIPGLKFIFLWRPASQVVDSLLSRGRHSTNPDYKINKTQAFKNWIWYNKQLLDFHEKHPENCILISINKIIKEDNQLLNLINEKFNMKLTYSPIEQIFDEELFGHQNSNFIDIAFSKVYGVSRIEHSLEEHSISL